MRLITSRSQVRILPPPLHATCPVLRRNLAYPYKALEFAPKLKSLFRRCWKRVLFSTDSLNLHFLCKKVHGSAKKRENLAVNRLFRPCRFFFSPAAKAAAVFPQYSRRVADFCPRPALFRPASHLAGKGQSLRWRKRNMAVCLATNRPSGIEAENSFPPKNSTFFKRSLIFACMTITLEAVSIFSPL